MTFFLMHLTGLLGMPRRIYTYTDDMGWTWLNLLSSVGSFVMAFGFALFALDVGLQIFLARRSPRNPWRAGTLEWAMPIPAPSYNFASQPEVADREPLSNDPALALKLARGEGYLALARHGWRETMAVDSGSGAIDHVVILPGNSRLPIVTAAVTGCFFLSVLLGHYWLALVPVIGVITLAWRWAWALGSRADVGPVAIGKGRTAPIHREVAGAPAWLGTMFLLVADSVLLASLLFGYAFLWVVAPNWPPPQTIDGGLGIGIVTALAGGAAMLLARQAESAGRTGLLVIAARRAIAAVCAQAVVIVGLLVVGFSSLPAPDSHAYAAVAWILLAYGVLHALIALLCTAFLRVRIGAGYVSVARCQEFAVARLFSDYAAMVVLILLLCLFGPGIVL
jgi:cytochrome c oxidase subunit I+III